MHVTAHTHQRHLIHLQHQTYLNIKLAAHFLQLMIVFFFFLKSTCAAKILPSCLVLTQQGFGLFPLTKDEGWRVLNAVKTEANYLILQSKFAF